MITTTQQSVLHVLAYQSLWNGKCTNAEAMYELLLQFLPEAMEVRAGLACAQIRNGKPEAALQTLTPLLDSDDPAVQLLLGKTFSMIGNTDRALQAMEAFCSRRPAWQKAILVDSEKADDIPGRANYA